MPIKDQLALCKRIGVEFVASPSGLIAGVAENVDSGLQPVNGLRHSPEGGATGWYIWAGEEVSTADDFFKPCHVQHLSECRPSVLPYLGLPPGWRFLIADGYEDVWFDPSLLEIGDP
jgi:hypothetical protein